MATPTWPHPPLPAPVPLPALVSVTLALSGPESLPSPAEALLSEIWPPLLLPQSWGQGGADLHQEYY